MECVSKTYVIYHLSCWGQDGFRSNKVIDVIRICLSEVARPFDGYWIPPMIDAIEMSALADMFRTMQLE